MIALDATYSFGANLSGVGVYSRELLNGLVRQSSIDVRWEWFFRTNRFFRAGKLPPNVHRRLLLERFGSRSAPLFHGLNQRLPERRFRRQIATFHDLFVLSAEYSTPEFRQRFAKQARHAAESSDLVIAVSQFTANQVEEYFGIPQSRIRVIHHGVLMRTPQCGQHETIQREKIVLCVGAIQKRKNQARLVRAFRALPTEWKLVLAGAEGYGAQETMDAVRDSPARSRIVITGYISDQQLANWYAKASIFAFLSLDEGFGMPALEAMAAGVPVIAGCRSALPEVCGDAAILVEPANEEKISDSLNDLARNENRRTELAIRGLQRAKTLTWDLAISKTASAYLAV